jgi:hypothetical protein
MNRVILERFHCSVPILYSGPHLDNLTPKKATYCRYNATLKALDFILSKKTSCFRSQTCNNVRFTLKRKVEETWRENKSMVYIVFGNPEVEYHHSYINYDLLSLIGEIGEILGITLGTPYIPEIIWVKNMRAIVVCGFLMKSLFHSNWAELAVLFSR